MDEKHPRLPPPEGGITRWRGHSDILGANAALMLQPLTGKRPCKRAMELIRFYLMGHASLDEVTALLALEKTEV